MIEKTECPRELSRLAFAACTTCPTVHHCLFKPDPEPGWGPRLVESNDPRECRGGWLGAQMHVSRTDPTDVSVREDYCRCPHRSIDACPWWEERWAHQAEWRANWLSAAGFMRLNRYPTAELLPPDIAEDVLRYAGEWPSRDRGDNVAIVGPVGSGKTTAAAYVVAVVGDGRLIDAHELFERIHTEHRLYGELATTSVLVVDDLGTEMASEIALVTWHRLVDERYNEGRPIVVTTNLENLGDLFVDERTRSRFMANLRVWRTERGDLRPLMERQEREREASSTDDTGP